MGTFLKQTLFYLLLTLPNCQGQLKLDTIASQWINTSLIHFGAINVNNSDMAHVHAVTMLFAVSVVKRIMTVQIVSVK